MEPQTPVQNEACTQVGSLRVAILGLAMFGFMLLWSNMRGDLPNCDVRLGSRSRIHPEGARHALFTVWRRTQIRYQPTIERLAMNIDRFQDSLVEFRQRIELRRTARRQHRSLTVDAIKAMKQIDFNRWQRVSGELFDDAERQMHQMTLNSMQNLIENTYDQVQMMRIELPRISADIQRDDRTTK